WKPPPPSEGRSPRTELLWVNVQVTSVRAVGPTWTQLVTVVPDVIASPWPPKLSHAICCRNAALAEPPVAKTGRSDELPESPTADTAGVEETATRPTVARVSASALPHTLRRPRTSGLPTSVRRGRDLNCSRC